VNTRSFPLVLPQWAWRGVKRLRSGIFAPQSAHLLKPESVRADRGFESRPLRRRAPLCLVFARFGAALVSGVPRSVRSAGLERDVSANGWASGPQVPQAAARPAAARSAALENVKNVVTTCLGRSASVAEHGGRKIAAS
jgi:hypothetical protein